jgi:hypothetical protein
MEVAKVDKTYFRHSHMCRNKRCLSENPKELEHKVIQNSITDKVKR